jgi:hypothetical protein
MFAKALPVSDWPVFKQVKQLLRLLFVDLAPDIPVSLTRSVSGNTGRKAAIQGFVVAFIFCFVVTTVWTLFEGTFSGDDPNRVYFSRDLTNLILYTTICPLYVGLGCWLAVTVISGWSEVKSLSVEIKEEPVPARRRNQIKAPVLAMVILGIAFFATSNYVSEVTAIDNVAKHYWFVEYSEATGRRLDSLGVYYFLLNFVLLVITLISITFFMASFSSLVEIGNALSVRRSKINLNFPVLRAKLATFTEAYMLAKWLTVLYMINIYLWRATPLGRTSNLIVAAFFVSLIGVLFVSIPRYFLELQWHRYNYRTGQIDEDSEMYNDLRPFPMRVVAGILDSLLIGGFILSFWSDRILN